jgi:serine/threonine-protein kinase
VTATSGFAPVRAGDVLAGKYRVERVLGAGGMGVVVAAHHLQLDQKVALKFLLPQALGNAEVVSRFDREARAAVRIKSEHVARVIDVGKLESGAPYIVMEFLEGGDLASWLDHRGALPVEQAVEFVLQACEAIAEAHMLGIVHRDLKPANLFCIRRPDGTLSIKVLDFGISKMTGLNASGDMGMTRTAAIVGSPFYMSPEQMHSAKGVDARTDIWALGVILYELLTNRVPFEAEAIPELVIKVLRDAPLSPAILRPEVPRALEQVVLRCLEKNRELRYPDIGALASALAEFAPARARHSVEVVRGIVGGPALPHVQPPPQAATLASWAGTGSAAGKDTRRPRRAVLVAAVAGTLVVGAAAAAVRGVLREEGEGPVDPPPTLADAAEEHTADAGVDAEVDAPIDTEASVRADAADGSEPRPRDRGLWRYQPPPPPPPPPATNCNPPYFYDAQGNRVFKIGCLP